MATRVPTIDTLRRYAISRSLFRPTALKRAIDRLGFVQADPIRAPARAQDLTLRHRVAGYRAGDLERRYPRLDVHEDFFVNYGFLTGDQWRRMHPRSGWAPWPAARRRQAQAVLEFVRARARPVHPREVDEHFAHGKVTNWFGGSSNATTQLLDAMHYRGWVRVARRDSGVRVYAAQEHAPRTLDPSARDAEIDALVDLVAGLYAPLPGPTLTHLISRLRGATPQWRAALPAAKQRARRRLAHARVGGVDWYWPADETLPRRGSAAYELDRRVRLLAPFDPIVWDRRRFELFWDWAYRFEAYTPAPKRKLGYYALPLLWRDRVIGWANVSSKGGALRADVGYVAGAPPDDAAFADELDAELARMQQFLGTDPACGPDETPR
jgi:hypothetical protein